MITDRLPKSDQCNEENGISYDNRLIRHWNYREVLPTLSFSNDGQTRMCCRSRWQISPVSATRYIKINTFLRSVHYEIDTHVLRNRQGAQFGIMLPSCSSYSTYFCVNLMSYSAHIYTYYATTSLCFSVVIIMLGIVWNCYVLTHWGRVTHICVSKLTIIGSDNGLSPGRRHAIIWTNAGISLIGPLGTKFSEILIEIHTFSFKKIHLKMSSGNGGHFVSVSMC